jgi:transcriptional regulator with XRE-family HTH domain
MSSRGVSGLALAKRIGISQNYIAKRLRHEASFTFNNIENIATALQIPVAFLVPGVGAAAAKTPSDGRRDRGPHGLRHQTRSAVEEPVTIPKER